METESKSAPPDLKQSLSENLRALQPQQIPLFQLFYHNFDTGSRVNLSINTYFNS